LTDGGRALAGRASETSNQHHGQMFKAH